MTAPKPWNRACGVEGCAYDLWLGGDVRWATGGRCMLAYPL
ncbi:MAG: hypothetical protein ABJN36_17575 [Cyclobacteriaceae bacterium]